MTNVVENKKQELWFLTGSQHLYGDETLKKVAQNSQQIADALDRSGKLPAKVVWKPILTGPEPILDVCLAANAAPGTKPTDRSRPAARRVVGLVSSPRRKPGAGLRPPGLEHPPAERQCHEPGPIGKPKRYHRLADLLQDLRESFHGGTFVTTQVA